MEEDVYDIVCDVCESTCEIIAEGDIRPEFCPFCGTPVE